MGEEPGTSGAALDPSDPEQIRAEIEDTRRELGETVAALSAKTDVKAQAKQHIDDTKAAIADKRDEALNKVAEISPDSVAALTSTGGQKARRNALPLAVAGAFAVGLLVGRRRQRRDD